MNTQPNQNAAPAWTPGPEDTVERLRAELDACREIKLKVITLTDYVSSQPWSVPGRSSIESAIERMKATDSLTKEAARLIGRAYDRFTDNDMVPANHQLAAWLQDARAILARLHGEGGGV